MTNQTGQTLKTLSSALREIADHVMITSPQGVIEYVNPAFEATTGYASHEVVGLRPNLLRSGQHGKDYYHKLWTTILSGGIFRATTANKKKNGDIYYADQTISPIYNDDGEIGFFVSVWKDATDRMLAEKRIQEERHKLEQVLGIEAGLHSILELNKLIDFVVKKTCEVLEAKKCSLMFIDQESKELCIKGHQGIEESQIGGNLLKMEDDWKDLIERYHKAEVQTSLQKAKIDGTVHQSQTFLSVPIELKDYTLGIMNVSHKKGKEGDHFTDLDLKILFMIVRQVRIAIENAKLYRELTYLTITDPVTGLYNHRHLNQILNAEIVRSKRYERNLSFLMIDIDQFKSYNDTLGHLEGDELLKTIAKVIKQNVRGTDMVCRYGGDEFAVVLPETDLNEAKIVAEKIRKAASELKLRQQITVSVGMSQCASKTDRHDLIQRADSHLYEAKKQGKNQISG